MKELRSSYFSNRDYLTMESHLAANTTPRLSNVRPPAQTAVRPYSVLALIPQGTKYQHARLALEGLPPRDINLRYMRSPSAAAAALSEASFDAILLCLSKTVRPDAVTQLRKISPTVPILVVSDDEAIGHAAVKLGAVDFLHGTDLCGALVLRAVKYAADVARLEAKNRATERQFRDAVEGSPAGLAIVDTSGKFQTVNRHYAEILGYSARNLIGKDLYSITHPDDVAKTRENLSRVTTGKIQNYISEKRFIKRDGKSVWVRINASPVRDQGGQTTGILGLAEDISTQVASDESLRESEAATRSLFESLTQGVLYFDVDGRIINANPAAEGLLGCPLEVMKGRSSAGLNLSPIHEDGTPFVGNDFPTLRALQTGEVVRGEVIGILTATATEYKWLVVDAVPQFKSGDSKPYQVYVLCSDITWRKRAEKTAARQVRRLTDQRAIDAAITSGMDLTAILNLVTEKACGLLGTDAASVMAIDGEQRLLFSIANYGFWSQNSSKLEVEFGDGIAGRVAADMRPVQLPQLVAEDFVPGRRQMLKREQFVSYFAVPLSAKGVTKGVLEVFSRKRLYPDPEWMDLLQTLGTQAAIAIDSATMFHDLQQSHSELMLSYDATIEGWSRAMDLRDKETAGHSQRVTDLTVFLARCFGVTDSEIVHIRRGALLHDIGKMGIPDQILLKPGSLTPDEWTIMKKHPVFAVQLLSPIQVLRPALDIPQYHHEKWDGSGYPHGLKRNEIPFSARIFALVDVWDALRSDRPYRPAWSTERVVSHIADLAGTHLDPEVVDTFMTVHKRGEISLGDLAAAA